MARISFDNLGSVGFLGDVLPHQLPPNAWSAGQNARMRDGYAKKIEGNTPIYGTPGVDPYWLLQCPTSQEIFWLYASLTAVYCVDSARNHVDISRAAGGPYAATLDNGWNGGLLQGLPVVNNGFDDPQIWNPVNATQRLVALPNWPANTKAKVIRPFKAFLFALDLIENGPRFPHKIRWSHPADPGAAPVTWDVTDTTKDAGQETLPDTGGFILDAKALRDIMVVYKEDQTWGFQYIGGNKIFRSYRILEESGAISRDCAASFFAGGVKHAVFGADDLFVHDGNNAESIADKRVRRWLYNQISSDNFERCFVVPNYPEKEIWFCFPSTGNALPNMALPWKWRENVFGMPRELPSIRFAAAGIVNDQTASTTWDPDTDTWDSDATLWDDRVYGAANRKLVLAVPGASKSFQLVDVTNQFAGSNFISYLQRTGIPYAKADQRGQPIADESVKKQVSELWPRIEAAPGTAVDIYVGAHEDVNGAITWQGPFSFVVGTHKKVDPLISGRFLGVKFQTNANVDWKLHGYSMEVKSVGKYG
jgi:hypothetical protein